MAISERDLSQKVITPVCEYLAANCGVPNTSIGRDLILVTAACESQLGTILPQGGITRIEEAVYRELLANYIETGPRFTPVMAMYFGRSNYEDLAGNLNGCVALTRLIYHRAKADTDPPPQPPSEYLDELWFRYSRVWSRTNEDAFRAYLSLTGTI